MWIVRLGLAQWQGACLAILSPWVWAPVSLRGKTTKQQQKKPLSALTLDSVSQKNVKYDPKAAQKQTILVLESGEKGTIGSHYVVQAGLELIGNPLPAKCWDYRQCHTLKGHSRCTWRWVALLRKRSILIGFLLFVPSLWCCWWWSVCSAKAGFELIIFLWLLPQYWDYRRVPPCLTSTINLNFDCRLVLSCKMQ